MSVGVLVAGCAELCHGGGSRLCQIILVVLGCAEPCHTGSARLCQTTQLRQIVPNCAMLVVLGCAKPAHGCQAVSSCASSAGLC